MANLKIENLQKTYGNEVIVRGISCSIEDGEFIVIVGPSGCGKSTVLRMIAGLESVSAGTIYIDGKDETHTPPERRGIAMVFQSYALYPHMTVRENMSFALTNLRQSKAEVRARVESAAQLLQLETLLDRLPSQLSGGQRQRVAIGRAIVREPKIFMLDEPLSNLDAELRVQMRRELGKLHKRLGNTMIYVTHDETEAMTLADRIILLNKGQVVQFGTPLEIYNSPCDVFAAGFLGSPRINLIDAVVQEVEDDRVAVLSPIGQLFYMSRARFGSVDAGDRITLGIRPEHVQLNHEQDYIVINATVGVVESLGDSSSIYCTLFDDKEFVFKIRGQEQLQLGSVITVYTAPQTILLFDDGGRLIKA